MMNFEELDDKTRSYMLMEFEAEELGSNPYRGKALSNAGKAAFADHMRTAIRTGTEATLAVALLQPAYWNPTEPYVRNGVQRDRAVNVAQAAERLSLTEFNTWYVRGLAKRLLQEGETSCEAYRGEQPKWEPAGCASHEGQVFAVQEILDGHRAGYWPEPGDPNAKSIPFGPSCHHTIRRVKKS